QGAPCHKGAALGGQRPPIYPTLDVMRKFGRIRRNRSPGREVVLPHAPDFAIVSRLSHAADRRPHGGGAYAESGFTASRTSRIAAECCAHAALVSRVAVLGAGAHDRGDLLFADGRSADSR